MEINKFGVPEKIGWRVSGDWKPSDLRSPYVVLTWRQFKDVIPFIFRFFCYWIRKVCNREAFFIDSFRPLCYFPYYGVPCGGLGSGSMGRDFRGAFCKYTLRPGIVEQNVTNVAENQFIVTIRNENKTVYQKVLTAAPPNPKTKLKSWDFKFPAKNLHYVGLYPQSWTTFEIPEFGVTLCCRQMSPVFPHDYKDTCLPVTFFTWTIENKSDTDLDISITFTFRNGSGDPRWQKEGHCSTSSNFRDFDPPGIDLKHTIDGMNCIYHLAAQETENLSVTSSTFDVTGNGSDLWNALKNNGHLEKESRSQKTDSSSIEKVPNQLGIALCCQKSVKSRKLEKFNTCLVWFMPKVWFIGKKRIYSRRYETWFANSGQLVKYALENCDQWIDKINNWQNTVLLDEKLPLWYRNALFNELYYLTDGGSVWFNFDPSWRIDEPHLNEFTCKLMQQHGRFAYLESFEYRMFTTYDVHFYSSFAFACLFPRLQLTIQAEFSDQIQNEDARPFRFFYSGDMGMIKHKNRVPHDLGCPAAEPWLETNAYVMHNTAHWKDLNLKFILTSIRDYFTIEDEQEKLEFLRHVWPNVQILINIGLNEWDTDKDGMIENGGTCDQTYDSWRMHGTSAYCGSLWLGAVKSAAKMAQLLHDDVKCKEYEALLVRASQAFEKKLWKDNYYKFDEASTDCDAVMADQLCGYWFLSCCGLEENILPEANVELSLRKVYNLNVGHFGAGKLGAANGRLASGKPDRISMQGDEMWTGVSYALASLMICKNMKEEGFKTAEGVYSSVFGPMGLQYQTPEAIYERKNYRAIGYMRAMAIWAMHWMMNRSHFLQNDDAEQ